MKSLPHLDKTQPRGSLQPQNGFFLDEVRGGLPWMTWLTPALLVTLLCIPCLGLTYLWDDYAFLDNAMRGRLWDYLPDASDPFYRPISRAFYFSLLSAAREGGEILGHQINLVVLAAIAMLISGLGARLGGVRVGICSGFAFAGLACIPTLVAWICCSQDLFAMFFVLVALHARLSGRGIAAWICVALAVLCKETALATIPALLILDRAQGIGASRIRRDAAAYVLLVALWILLHPGIRTLLGRGLQPGSTGYIGLGRAVDIAERAGLYLLELANLRVWKLTNTWSSAETLGLALTAIAAAAALYLLLRRPPVTGIRIRPAIITGVTLAAGPLILSSAMILGWGHYYAAFPGMGASLVFGGLLAMRSRAVAATCIAIFLTLGLWSRATDLEADYVTENNLRISSDAHRKFRESLLRAQPVFPPGSQLLFSVQASGRARVYHQVYLYQMPSVWYRDPTIVSRKPEDRVAGEGPEYLIAVLHDLDVVFINPATGQVASASGRNPHYLQVEQALRTYAVGLWGSGETDAGARLLIEMPEIDRNWEAFHHRIAAAMLLADGRSEDAQSLLAGVPPAERNWALKNLPAILAQQPQTRNLDASAMRAFGVDSTDADALRSLSGWLLYRGYYEPAGRIGTRLLNVAPDDQLGKRTIAARDSVRTVLARVRVRGA